MRHGHDLLGRRLIESGDHNIERHLEYEATATVWLQAHNDQHHDVGIHHPSRLVAGDADHRIFEACRIAGREQLLRIGGAALAAHCDGQRQRKIENTVVAAKSAAASATAVTLVL